MGLNERTDLLQSGAVVHEGRWVIGREFGQPSSHLCSERGVCEPLIDWRANKDTRVRQLSDDAECIGGIPGQEALQRAKMLDNARRAIPYWG
jgi:hypothetical protein